MNDYLGPGFALEAIDVQNGAFFRELVEIFGDYHTGSIPDPVAQGKLTAQLKKYINTFTGLNLVVQLSYEVNSIELPSIDAQHPLLGHFQEYYGSHDGLKMIAEGNGLSTGQIDLARSRVSGDFTKYLAILNVDLGMFTSGFSTEEMVALVLHEVGHLFTYLEMLDRTCSTNLVLAGLDATLRGSDVKKREYALRTVGRYYDLPKDVVDNAVSSTSDKSVMTVYISSAMYSIRSQTGHSFYDMNGSEMAADQFAARHGAGRYLVTALDKMYRLYGNKIVESKAAYLRMEVLNVSKVLALSLAGITAPVLLAMVTPAAVIAGLIISMLSGLQIFAMLETSYLHGDSVPSYDKPTARALRVRRELVDYARQPKLPKAVAKRLLEDVKTIDETISLYNKEDLWLEKAMTYLSKSHRDRRDSVNLQKELEGLALNDLFLKSLELKHA